MAKKFPLLLLDANVVIELFRLGLWDKVLECCDVHLSRTIVQREAHFFKDSEGSRHDFDLREYEASGQITVFDVELSEVRHFALSFDPTYFERLDPGETEAMTHLLTSPAPYLICSADSIVFKVLGNLNRAEQGISLEEVLNDVGLGRRLTWRFTRAFRDKWTKRGFVDHLGGMGKKI